MRSSKKQKVKGYTLPINPKGRLKVAEKPKRIKPETPVIIPSRVKKYVTKVYRGDHSFQVPKNDS